MNTPSTIPRNILGAALVLSFVGSISALFRFEVAAANKDIIVFALGQLSGFVGAVVVFYFGSTEGSRHKNELLAQKAPVQPVEVVNPPSEPVPVVEAHNA